MDTKSRIKVIKRNEQPTQPAVKIKAKSAQTAAREMVATVTGWVNEFQQKRREETQEAFNKFLSQTPTPNGCGNC